MAAILKGLFKYVHSGPLCGIRADEQASTSSLSCPATSKIIASVLGQAGQTCAKSLLAFEYIAPCLPLASSCVCCVCATDTRLWQLLTTTAPAQHLLPGRIICPHVPSFHPAASCLLRGVLTSSGTSYSLCRPSNSCPLSTIFLWAASSLRYLQTLCVPFIHISSTCAVLA
ncbi:hypothetical protein BDY19DRAFT_52452 [Irpex rosettiformis]|uniref:Uncharacterized protein n=1 Tax=Irpex rosettiformis TaxID=378272 RepID=A0ACB8UMA7_9APHY|nr:hypothetical protein BDY19DRAFT_52452 [Irpex rosettiformis]